jgi:hypothetical protein
MPSGRISIDVRNAAVRGRIGASVDETRSVPTASPGGVSLDRFAEAAAAAEGLDIRRVVPLTVLRVQTRNSEYRVVVGADGGVFVEGGRMFPQLTAAYVEGASVGTSCVKAGWILVGLRLELRAGDRRVITSQVLAITTEYTPVAAAVH